MSTMGPGDGSQFVGTWGQLEDRRVTWSEVNESGVTWADFGVMTAGTAVAA